MTMKEYLYLDHGRQNWIYRSINGLLHLDLEFIHHKRQGPRSLYQPHYNIIKKLKNSEILAISEKIQRDENLSEYFKMFDKSLKLPY